jgi:hypothetical protein
LPFIKKLNIIGLQTIKKMIKMYIYFFQLTSKMSSMLDIIEALENKIDSLESILFSNSLNTKIRFNDSYIELLETKLNTEFMKNNELRLSIISLETRLKEQTDQLFSINYMQKSICIADAKITNDAIKLFEDKLEIEFAKNDDLRREIISLENQLSVKNQNSFSLDLNKSPVKLITNDKENDKLPSKEFNFIILQMLKPYNIAL